MTQDEFEQLVDQGETLIEDHSSMSDQQSLDLIMAMIAQIDALPLDAAKQIKKCLREHFPNS